MAERITYELTDGQLIRLLDASKPVPAMALSGGQPMFGTPRENAEREWQRLGAELGFKWQTARPIPGRDHRFFTAEKVDG